MRLLRRLHLCFDRNGHIRTMTNQDNVILLYLNFVVNQVSPKSNEIYTGDFALEIKEKMFVS